MNKETSRESVEDFNNIIKDIKSQLSKVVIGQQSVVELMLTSLFANGHALLVGVPGLAKTMLVKALSLCLNLRFNRIQFTPDLMPSDIIGGDILEEDEFSKKRSFKFIKGPVFSNIILADEINRTPPKTQAALLQAMQEYFVSASGKHHELIRPFIVFATQNPIEQEGTYNLPEAQLDRFMFNIVVDYPNKDEEEKIVLFSGNIEDAAIKPVINPDKILMYQKCTENIPVPDNVVKYTVELVRKSRPSGSKDKFIKDMIKWGGGPRASQYLISAARAYAFINGRTAVNISDIKTLAYPVLRHRIIPSFNAQAENIGSEQIIKYLINNTDY